VGFPCCSRDILDSHATGFLKPRLVHVVPCYVGLKGQNSLQKAGPGVATCFGFLQFIQILAKGYFSERTGFECITGMSQTCRNTEGFGEEQTPAVLSQYRGREASSLLQKLHLPTQPELRRRGQPAPASLSPGLPCPTSRRWLGTLQLALPQPR